MFLSAVIFDKFLEFCIDGQLNSNFVLLGFLKGPLKKFDNFAFEFLINLA